MAVERLGDILLLEKLAAGGMAEVFRAKQYGHSGFEKTIAVKRILPNYSSSVEFQDMFKAEANLSALLQHSNLAQVYSNGQLGNYFFIVMEYVDGKNLRQVFSQSESLGKTLSVPFMCYVVCETAKGLDYAHNFVDERTGESLGIIHRDVNHQNIMIGYDGAVKIIDFGVAKAKDDDRSKTKAGVLKGKFSYMSPEQVRGRKIDRRTDIFSLGVVLWELVSGQPLFVGEDELETLEKVRDCKVPYFKEFGIEVPAQLEEIIRKALAADPSMRYATAAELVSAIQKFQNDTQTSFYQADATKYMKELFEQQILEERNRKELWNQEARVYLTKNPILRSSGTKIFGDTFSPKPLVETQIRVLRDDVDKTNVSQVGTVVSNTQNTSNVKIPDNPSMPSWKPSNSTVSAVRFEYDQSMNTNVYSSAIQNHSNKLVVFLLVIAVGVIYMWFNERERMLYASYEGSKSEKWNQSFRDSFVTSCASDTDIPRNFNALAFCSCIASPIEKAQVLYTKYNPNLITAEAQAQINLAEYKKYLETSGGIKAKTKCLETSVMD